MKTLVAFYSRTGNTKKVAGLIADKLDADLDRIKDKKNREGILGWFGGIKDGGFKKKTEIKNESDPEDYDLVIVGTSIWAGNMSPAIRTYLDKCDFDDLVFFCTCRDNQSKTFENMEKLSKGPRGVLELTKNDFETGDLEAKIEEFIRKIK